jgi:hypothetical protein
MHLLGEVWFVVAMHPTSAQAPKCVSSTLQFCRSFLDRPSPRNTFNTLFPFAVSAALAPLLLPQFQQRVSSSRNSFEVATVFSSRRRHCLNVFSRDRPVSIASFIPRSKNYKDCLLIPILPKTNKHTLSSQRIKTFLKYFDLVCPIHKLITDTKSFLHMLYANF